jgi:hypothetical protein
MVPSANSALAMLCPTMAEVQPELPLEGGLEKAMVCCIGDGIPTQGCASGLGSSLEIAMLLETNQGRQTTPVSTVSRANDHFVSPDATVEAFVSPTEASISSLAVVCVPLEVAHVKVDRITASEKGFLRRGVLGSRNSSPSLPAMKEASSLAKGSKVVIEESQVCSSSMNHVAELGSGLSQPFPRMLEGGAPIYSSVSKSQIRYARRVK